MRFAEAFFSPAYFVLIHLLFMICFYLYKYYTCKFGSDILRPRTWRALSHFWCILSLSQLFRLLLSAADFIFRGGPRGLTFLRRVF